MKETIAEETEVTSKDIELAFEGLNEEGLLNSKGCGDEKAFVCKRVVGTKAPSMIPGKQCKDSGRALPSGGSRETDSDSTTAGKGKPEQGLVSMPVAGSAGRGMGYHYS